MGRTPNLAISNWFTDKTNRRWALDARCAEHCELPWTRDGRPDLDQYQAMRAVCSQCPVIGQCAAYGLTTAGGFYAGVWIPWKNATETSQTKHERDHGRTLLRRLARQG